MGCPKNPVERRFLFWKWTGEGPHKFKVVDVYPWPMEMWKVTRQCRFCGARTVWFLSDVDAVRRGLVERE